MIFVETFLKIEDNSGGKMIRTIRIFNKGKFGRINNFIKGSVRSLNKRVLRKMKIGVIIKSLILRVKHKLFRYDGSTFQFHLNAIVVLKTNQTKLVGSRLYGPICFESRNKKVEDNSRICRLARFIL